VSAPRLERLSGFISDLDALLSRAPGEAERLSEGRALLGALVACDDWLPDPYAASDPKRYQQYLLYRDPEARFSVVSFVWGPGQATPIHNHTVWGLIGVLRGAELSQAYEILGGSLSPRGGLQRLKPGEVEAVSPAIGDIHRVANAFGDRVSVSIHVYGGDIGQVERSAFDDEGRARRFVSGYAPVPPPPLAVEARR